MYAEKQNMKKVHLAVCVVHFSRWFTIFMRPRDTFSVSMLHATVLAGKHSTDCERVWWLDSFLADGVCGSSVADRQGRFRSREAWRGGNLFWGYWQFTNCENRQHADNHGLVNFEFSFHLLSELRRDHDQDFHLFNINTVRSSSWDSKQSSDLERPAVLCAVVESFWATCECFDNVLKQRIFTCEITHRLKLSMKDFPMH